MFKMLRSQLNFMKKLLVLREFLLHQKMTMAKWQLGPLNWLLLQSVQESNLDLKPFGIELAFTTDNVAETVQKALKAGGTIYAEIVTKSWGQTVGYVRDLNGFLVEICTPIEN